jgi:hypothetical protein
MGITSYGRVAWQSISGGENFSVCLAPRYMAPILARGQQPVIVIDGSTGSSTGNRHEVKY